MKSFSTYKRRFLQIILVAACLSPATTSIAALLYGNIYDTSWTAIDDALVSVFSGENRVAYNLAEDGFYIFWLSPGTYDLHVSARNYEYIIRKDIVVQYYKWVTISGVRREGIISGKITKPNGITPISDVAVAAEDASGFGRCDVTDGSGNYSITQLPPGTYTVTAVDDDHVFPDSSGVSVTLGQTTGINIVATGSGKIAGIVTKRDGVTPIADALVVVLDAHYKVFGTASTNSSGNYMVTGLLPGVYSVEAWGSEDRMVAIDKNVSVANEQTTTANLSSGSISGSVKNSNQVAIAGASITASGDNMGGMFEITSDYSGNYQIELAPGNYKLTVLSSNQDYIAQLLDDVTVTQGQQTTNVNFILSGPAGKISGTITNESQVPIQGATVIAIPDSLSRPFVGTTTDSDGDYTIQHLDTGTYTINVMASGYVSDSETNVSVSAGQTTSDKNFTLGTSGGAISGTVYKSDGQTPIENALILCGSEGKSSASAVTDSSGHYLISPLQAGSYQLYAYKLGYQTASLQNIVVTGTQTNSGNDFSINLE